MILVAVLDVSVIRLTHLLPEHQMSTCFVNTLSQSSMSHTRGKAAKEQQTKN